jgi:acetyl esterase/lipase
MTFYFRNKHYIFFVLKSCNDPFLDDNLHMAKRLRAANAECELLIVDNGSPHGYLNMQSLVGETHEAFAESLAMIKLLLEHFERDGAASHPRKHSTTSSNKY